MADTTTARIADISLSGLAEIRGIALSLTAMLQGHPAVAALELLQTHIDTLHNDVDVAAELAGV